MEFKYKINLESQKVTITGIKDCPNVLNIPSSIIHTDGKEYDVDSVRFGKLVGKKEDDDLICESISFSSTITSIAIFKNSTIKEIILPNRLVEIKKYAFLKCENLEKVVFPDCLEIIGDGAFDGCKSLKEVIIPDSVKKIGNFAFKDCVSLTYTKLSNTLTELGFKAFSGCLSLQKIATPDSLEWISNYAFKDCVMLSDVQIHNNQNFTPTSFIGCVALKSLGEGFIVEHGFLFNKEKTEMYTWLGTQEQSLVDFVVPSTVRLLGNGFSECKGIRSIDLSLTKITEIYDESFKECLDLQKVVLPKGIKKIGERAFCDCSKLESLNLPDSIEELSVACFMGCALKEVFIPTGLKIIPKSSFMGCSNLKYVVIPENIQTINNSAFSGCTSIKGVRISIGFRENIDKIFENSNHLNIEYIQRYTSRYFTPMTGAYTHGRLRPCPYCGSDNVRTYIDGTAECESCGGEYTYWR